jgi:hypothetical protein
MSVLQFITVSFGTSFPSNKEHQVKTRKNILTFAVYLNSSYYSDFFFIGFDLLLQFPKGNNSKIKPKREKKQKQHGQLWNTNRVERKVNSI